MLGPTWWVDFETHSMYSMYKYMGVEPKIGGKPPKWMVFIMENPIEMDDLGVSLFSETSIYIYTVYIHTILPTLIIIQNQPNVGVSTYISPIGIEKRACSIHIDV